ncbi:substrate-binding periplasmic protein [Pseudomonas sp. LRF_L74]|uniref:substrate-binding periplasmic protein n=1 Tax=Pseudomonas sp. LRF_L74 TaxID=3369422 RepID=UPI003F635835
MKAVVPWALLAWVFCSSLYARAEPLRLVANPWAPFTDQGLLNGGLATDLVATALRRGGHDSRYIEVPWARALRGLQQGDYDVIVSAWYSDERALYGLFSQPYLFNRIRLLQRRADEPIRIDSMADMLPYSIAVVRGYSYSAAFDGNESLHKVPVMDFTMASRMLAAGRVRLVLEDELVAEHYLKLDTRTIKDDLVFLPVLLKSNGLHILVRRSLPDCERIVADFDREIAAMKADGTYLRIYEQHGLTPTQ